MQATAEPDTVLSRGIHIIYMHKSISDLPGRFHSKVASYIVSFAGFFVIWSTPRGQTDAQVQDAQIHFLSDSSSVLAAVKRRNMRNVQAYNISDFIEHEDQANFLQQYVHVSTNGIENEAYCF